MLQNRCAPDGTLHRNAARGMFTGNRGILHDPDTRELSGRRWTTKAWICCALQWKDAKRQVFGRNGRNGRAGWSELFFADEVTALAAGHRPCHACRRDKAEAFAAAWAIVHGPMPAPSRDAVLHGERWLSSGSARQRLSPIDLPALPDGTMVEAGGIFFALKERRALEWSFNGYGKPAGLSELVRGTVNLITPRSIVGALKAGYEPVWHPTSESL